MKKLLLLASLIAAGCAPDEPRKVVYEVDGTASAAAITMQNAQGGSEQRTVALPWQTTMTVSPGAFVYVSAQNQDGDGTVTCDILVDGTSLQRSSSAGPYVISTCSGTVPAG